MGFALGLNSADLQPNNKPQQHHKATFKTLVAVISQNLKLDFKSMQLGPCYLFRPVSDFENLQIINFSTVTESQCT